MVSVTDACQNDFFNKLTNCSYGEWTWSTDGDAIKVLSPDGTQVYFSGAPGSCQADDIFKFSADGTFGYEANGQTFDVQAGYSCQNPKPNAPKYKVVARTGEAPKIILDSLETGPGRPFIGTTDIVDNNLYKVEAYTDNSMTLRSTLEGSGGVILEIKLKKSGCADAGRYQKPPDRRQQQSWKLDPAPGANAIIVGTESTLHNTTAADHSTLPAKRMTFTLSPAQTLLIIMPTEPLSTEVMLHQITIAATTGLTAISRTALAPQQGA